MAGQSREVEAYHTSFQRWFAVELRAQQVVGLEHIQQLLEAVLALVYNRHSHSQISTTPEQRLAGRISPQRVSQADLERAFFVETTAISNQETGEVHLPNGQLPRALDRLRGTMQPIPLPACLRRSGGPRPRGWARDRAATLHAKTLGRRRDPQ